jgi:CRISPR-associated endonuclease Csn1
MGYRIGIDVGDRSIGLAAVEYDTNGTPTRILAAVSHIHDGGLDPDTAKSPLSRIHTSGVARRTRRLLRNRRKRLARLDNILREEGLPVHEHELPQTHDAWHYRNTLSRNYEPNTEERLKGVSMAVRHIARHRGWRNPWWSWTTLRDAPAPSDNFTQTRDAAIERFGPAMATCRTMGQMVMAIASSGAPIRPTKKATTNNTPPLMARRIDQVDSLHELRLILTTQQFTPQQIERICAATFWQEKPHIPADRIGTCPILGKNEPRATRASLEHQEYRIRSSVANLRIRKGNTPLTSEQHDLVVNYLLNWREDDRPRWSDVAELLGLNTRELAIPTVDDMGGTGAVCDRTSQAVEQHFKKKTPVRLWWDKADHAARAEFVELITDITGNDTEPTADGLTELLTDESNLETIEKFATKESGRSAYSRKALEELNKQMREHRCDAHEARKRAFGLTDDWQPPKAGFDEPVDHPAVDRINTILRRFLTTAITKWGQPDQVMVEHVRAAFMGPTARAELINDINRNTKRRDNKKAELTNQGFQKPSNADIRKLDSLTLQQGMCLYCGTALTLATTELDHIVPRANGGGNTRDNLVAVCRPCNQEKNRLPFAVWANNTSRPGVSLDAARERVKAFKSDDIRGRALYRLKADVTRRLNLETDDSGDMDRSIESTAYAAREMRRRIEATLGIDRTSITDPDQPRVHVFAGIVTAEARKAGEIDGLLKLRNMSKSKRFDRRHHAVDALILTTLQPGIARTLKNRAELKTDAEYTGDDTNWRNYAGRTAPETQKFTTWKTQASTLATLITEAISRDTIAVTRPLRLTPRIGAIHKDTIEKLVLKPLAEAFTSDEIERVVEPHLYTQLADLTSGTNTLPADPHRTHHLNLPDNYTVKLFPTNAAYIPVRGGAAKIGDTIKHARIYAWRTKTGFNYGMIRVYGAEYNKIGFLKPGVNILTEPLPAHSQSLRHANPALIKRIESGEAKQIGWITIDDEIELNPDEFITGTEKLPRFLQESPERRWTITGFFTPGQVSIAPSYLAFEGADDTTPEIIAQTLKDNRIAMTLNVLFQDPTLTIIRRTALGTVRWNNNGLPASWKPSQAAERLFNT